jgi:transposase InsO family protein
LGRNDAVLRTRLSALAEAYPRYGYPTLHEMLKTEGLVINRKRTYRLYREERLQVRYLSGARSWLERAPRCACQAQSMHFIQPGKPTQNAFIESFNGKFRAYCLDLNWFASLNDAREIIERWRTHYNHVRPHRSLGKPPAVFAREIA